MSLTAPGEPAATPEPEARDPSESKHDLSEFRYVARRHAYQRTREYLFAQLIPYIGSKRKLLPLIARAIELTGAEPATGVFADLFAGSGAVSRLAKQLGYAVAANDWEPYAATINGAVIALDQAPLPDSFFDDLNSLPPLNGYITRNFCPADDSAPEPLAERCFYTRENGMRIDAIRQHIADLEESGEIEDSGRNYLLAPLLSAASYVSNTSGVFKAYHAGWGGATSTALYRIRSKILLRPPVLLNNGRNCVVTRQDATSFAQSCSAQVLGPLDVAYLDPPYNQHPYGSNYHLLNTIALWDKPEIPAFADSKSAIRGDWRVERRSAYNSPKLALEALVDLVDTLCCRWVLLSYSTDGNIDLQRLTVAFAERGRLQCLAQPYKRYRVSAQRISAQSHNVEFILLLDRKQRPLTGQAEQVADAISFQRSTEK